MARPRKDSGERGAQERMVQAFWEQLSRMPYREISAASVARESRCNRATFYYHFDSVEDQAVTVRDRDTMAQERIPLAEVKSWLIDKLGAC
mgnify:CR=1 FL=1